MEALRPFRIRRMFARISVAALAVGAIAWSVFVVPKFWSEAAIAQVATHVIAGEAYKPDILDSLIPQPEGETALRPSILSKAVVIQLRRAEDSLGAGQTDVIDARLDSLGLAIDHALAGAPTDPFLWLVLFWLDSTRNGFVPADVGYLQMSYDLGPNEGWIAVKRNRFALAIMTSLPTGLSDRVISEFVGLVRSQLYYEAADILAGAGWPTRQVLLPRLEGLAESNRRRFAGVLRERNIEDVAVPGIETPSEPHWR
jgi:hypothetical protein